MDETGFRWDGNDLILDLQIQPKSSRLSWGPLHQGRIKLFLTTPPTDNQANKQCLQFVAKSLKVGKSQVSILQGHTHRSKTLLVKNVDSELWNRIFQEIQNT